MKVAICCIAKDEDNYIDQWIQYHLKLGFDDIYIHCNDWIYQGKYINDERVILINYNGRNKQMVCYNEFIKNHYKEYDWCAFIDIDEFITLKQNKDIHSFLENYNQYNALGLNWLQFVTGDVKYDGKNFSLVNRFKQCRKNLNRHIKVLINFKLSQDKVNFSWNPHNIAQDNLTITVDKQNYINGPWNYKNLEDKSIAYISHYFFKTKQQYTQKISRGHPIGNSCAKWQNFTNNDGDLNEPQEIDLTAFNFYNNL